jgi:antitoxin YefM
MSLADYESLQESLQETAYLLRAPANARRLLEAIRQASEGEREEHPLAE